ncbi:MAG: hypothetical protein EB034_24465, partial [Verrucomicrobia bacterium]|nr:hypothetical protein [Verrucomicrobiota bacterium]
DKTIGIVDRIQRDHGLTAMMHLTCVNATKEELTGVINEARQRGIKNILALRGDPPGEQCNSCVTGQYSARCWICRIPLEWSKQLPWRSARSASCRPRRFMTRSYWQKQPCSTVGYCSPATPTYAALITKRWRSC